MAKTSMIVRNRQRAEVVARYADAAASSSGSSPRPRHLPPSARRRRQSCVASRATPRPRGCATATPSTVVPGASCAPSDLTHQVQGDGPPRRTRA